MDRRCLCSPRSAQDVGTGWRPCHQRSLLRLRTPPQPWPRRRTSCAALEGERKQVTVLFADIKDLLELIRGLDPEAAQQLLDLLCMP